MSGRAPLMDLRHANDIDVDRVLAEWRTERRRAHWRAWAAEAFVVIVLPPVIAVLGALVMLLSTR